ncbi:MAG: roadblock/LC7 domain-containing protein [Euryarchaeota archaeon]|nr:roadblock/LC7 domain-containing protein [Euryarchaeota archaeon]
MERTSKNNAHCAGIPNGVAMSQTTIDQLNVLLADMTARVDCIRGVVISSADGLKIADRFRDHSYDTPIVHAISASIVGLANKSVHNLGLPPSDRVVIYTGEGIVAVFNLGNASLLTLLDPGANVGLVMIELQHAAEKVKKVMRL